MVFGRWKASFDDREHGSETLRHAVFRSLGRQRWGRGPRMVGGLNLREQPLDLPRSHGKLLIGSPHQILGLQLPDAANCFIPALVYGPSSRSGFTMNQFEGIVRLPVEERWASSTSHLEKRRRLGIVSSHRGNQKSSLIIEGAIPAGHIRW